MLRLKTERNQQAFSLMLLRLQGDGPLRRFPLSNPNPNP